jgi:hypothetical protein
MTIQTIINFRKKQRQSDKMATHTYRCLRKTERQYDSTNNYFKERERENILSTEKHRGREIETHTIYNDCHFCKVNPISFQRDREKERQGGTHTYRERN